MLEENVAVQQSFVLNFSLLKDTLPSNQEEEQKVGDASAKARCLHPDLAAVQLNQVAWFCNSLVKGWLISSQFCFCG